VVYTYISLVVANIVVGRTLRGTDIPSLGMLGLTVSQVARRSECPFLKLGHVEA